MRILLVNYRYFISGGPERYMFNIKHVLEKNGHEVIPFSNLSSKNVETPYSHYFVEPIGSSEAVYYEEYKKTPKVLWKMLSRSIYSFEVEKAIRKEIRDVKPDLVYIIHFVNKLSPSVIRGAKKEGLPVVLRLSDYFLLCPRFDFLYRKKICEDCLTKGYRTCIKRRCVKNSLSASVIRVAAMKIHKLIKVYEDIDAFVAPSEFLKSKLSSHGFEASKIHCIPTFTKLNPSSAQLPVGSYGLYFGRITEEKSVMTIIKAYEKLPDHKVKIVGDTSTEEAERLQKYVSGHNLDNIEFTGFKNSAEIGEIISQARFTLISSICYENLPNAALESMNYAKPIIASNIGSLPEVVADGITGLLFEPGNASDLCQKIKQLDDDDKVLKMGIAGRNKLENDFSSEKHYQALIKLFRNLCGKE